jgi:hypothetical protein
MAKTNLPAEETKATIGISKTVWKRFKAKCKKAGLSASERIRQLVAADLKV